MSNHLNRRADALSAALDYQSRGSLSDAEMLDLLDAPRSRLSLLLAHDDERDAVRQYFLESIDRYNQLED